MSEIENDERPGHSTGPRTPAGRERSSQNASTHGLCCEKFFLLPDEKPEDFDALAQTLVDEYKDVASPGLEPLLKNLVEALWLQNRAYRKISDTENAIYWHEYNREFEKAEKAFKRLFLMQRYKTSYENSYQRALRAIEAFRKNRIAECVAKVRIEKTLQSMAIVRAKTAAPLTGRYSAQQLQEAVNKLSSSPFADIPYWSPQRSERQNR